MRTIQTYLIPILILLVGLQFVRAPGPSRKNELNLSKVAAEPIVFWPIQTSKHNLPTQKRLAYLHGTLFTSGPNTNAGILDALKFLPGSKSFTFIPNNGIMNGENAMCWMLFLYIPNNAQSQSSVLIAYEGIDGLPGFELGIASGKLSAVFYDMDGNAFGLTSSISLEPSKWQFIGINFNMLWKDNQFDFFLIDHKDLTVTTDTHSLSPTDTLRLNAHGSIILGANHLNQRHFAGKMACIQFYNTSIIGGTQEDAVGLCDPNTWSHADYGEYTIDANTETTTQQTTTTMSTTTQFTTISSTTQPQTTKTPTTTRQPNISQLRTTTQTYTAGCSTEDICRCVDKELNEEELANKIMSLKTKLLVNKKTTSMRIRTRTCAEDDRTSAKVIGQCGVAVLTVVTGLLVIEDAVNVVRTVFSVFRHLCRQNS